MGVQPSAIPHPQHSQLHTPQRQPNIRVRARASLLQRTTRECQRANRLVAAFNEPEKRVRRRGDSHNLAHSPPHQI